METNMTRQKYQRIIGKIQLKLKIFSWSVFGPNQSSSSETGLSLKVQTYNLSETLTAFFIN